MQRDASAAHGPHKTLHTRLIRRGRAGAVDRHITPCISGRANRKASVTCDAGICTRRNLVERKFGSAQGLAQAGRPI
jgi:hypothetical protein